uniref:Cytochrome n=1 Tax=Lutzomyia longipalpis TaxID=7200 RepID=A0A1B0CAG6_LUTLO
FCGYFELRNPSFLIRDPELIKNLVVKDCETFLDHRLDSKHCSDLLFSRSLVKLSGTEWKDMRSTLSPAFTGSKLRTMFMFMTECCNSSVQYLEESANGKPMLMDMTDMFCRFTADIFGTCIFGIRVDSFRNPNNDFYLNGKKSVDFSGLRGLRTFFMGNFPKFTNFFGITSCEKNNANYFRNLIWDTIHQREGENIVRSDMIQLLMQARSGKLHYENKEEDEIGYAAVKETNLGKTISQSKNLRLWPTGIMFNRIANKPYNLEVDGKSYKINVGERILIPVLPLHRDPKYFPDPLRFDPERFSKNNIKNIKPY